MPSVNALQHVANGDALPSRVAANEQAKTQATPVGGSVITLQQRTFAGAKARLYVADVGGVRECLLQVSLARRP